MMGVTPGRPQVENSARYRLRNPATGEYLRLDGEGTTRSVTWSWIGTRDQLRTICRRAAEAGRNWPFAPMLREQDTQNF